MGEFWPVPCNRRVYRTCWWLWTKLDHNTGSTPGNIWWCGLIMKHVLLANVFATLTNSSFAASRRSTDDLGSDQSQENAWPPEVMRGTLATQLGRARAELKPIDAVFPFCKWFWALSMANNSVPQEKCNVQRSTFAQEQYVKIKMSFCNYWRRS